MRGNNWSAFENFAVPNAQRLRQLAQQRSRAASERSSDEELRDQIFAAMLACYKPQA